MATKSESPASSKTPIAGEKKLKQTRLPFQIISSSPSASPKSVAEVKKRRLSSEEGLPASKIVKVADTKENVAAKPPAAIETIVLDDDDVPSGANGDGKKEDEVEKGFFIKLPLAKGVKRAKSGGDTSMEKSSDDGGATTKEVKHKARKHKKRRHSKGGENTKAETESPVEVQVEEEAEKSELAQKAPKAPKVAEKRSTEAEEVPTEEVQKPLQDSGKSVQENEKPVQENEKPVQENEKSVQEPEEPVQEPEEPAQEPEEPAQEPEEPAQEPEKPVQAPETVPSEEVQKPLQDSVKSVQEPEKHVQELEKASEIKVEEEISLGCHEQILSSATCTPSKPLKATSPQKDALEKPKPDEVVTPSTSSKVFSTDGDVGTPNRTPKSSKKLSPAAQAAKIKRLNEEKLRKQREREEKEAARLREKEEKETARRLEKEAKDEARRREREEREEAKRREREEKERQKQAELDKKQEEKRRRDEAKEEERRKKDEAKEEERRKKDEERRRVEEKEVKAKQHFERFFLRKKSAEDAKPAEEESSKESTETSEALLTFTPFQVKKNMRLAPTVRAQLDQQRRERLEMTLSEAEKDTELYLAGLKQSEYKAGRSTSTWPLEDEKDDIILIDDMGAEHEIEPDTKEKRTYRAKFLMFFENQRPPYYGTWRKKSATITGRRPFATDKEFFDYEVDSDDEWELEEAGESLHGSDDEKDKESEDDYEVDNEFFVPHGHLSEEEIEHEDDFADNSPEAQKAKLKLMQLEFAAEMKKKTEKIKPRLFGCIWTKDKEAERGAISPLIADLILARAMLLDDEQPLVIQFEDPVDSPAATVANTPSTRKLKIPDEALPDLVRLVHGNTHNRKFLVKEFTAWRQKQHGDEEGFREYINVAGKIKELAEWRQCQEEGSPMLGKLAWFVHPEALERHGLADLPLVNAWMYTLKPKATKSVADPEKTPLAPKRAKIPDEALPDLIRLVHGNTHNRKFLVKEFTAWRQQQHGDTESFHEFVHVGNKIREIAVWRQCQEEGNPMQGKLAWFVKPEVLERHHVSVELPNKWTYTEKPATASDQPSSSTAAAEAKPSIDITKFTKVLSADDKQKQFEEAAKAGTQTSSTATQQPQPAGASAQPAKKRVQLLMSVPRGQAISTEKKNTLIEQFLKKGDEKKETPMEVDEVIVLE